MHIPDGMVSPSTSIAALAVMAPVWLFAGRKVMKDVKRREVPLLAICAAFSFTIMMFNVPALGGTTAHAVGSTLIAILLGPWAAILAVTVALAIQALFFADGGVLAIGANSFAMAFVQPVIGYLVFKALVGASGKDSRHFWSAGVASYVAILMASLVVAVFLGIQPAFFRDATGHALYFPFGLKVTLAGIIPTHLVVAGPIEALVTVAAVKFAYANGIGVLRANQDQTKSSRADKLGIALLSLLALSPLGLLATGEAWGEWDAKTTGELAGYVPSAIEHQEKNGWAGFGFLSDYASERGPLFYILAGVIGVLAIGLVIYLFGKLLKKEEPPTPSQPTNDHKDDAALPSWLTQSSEDSPQSMQRGRVNRFAEKSLGGMTDGIQTMLQAETTTLGHGWLQKIDPRVKVASLIGLTVVTACLHQGLSLAVLCTLSVVLAIGSRLKMRSFLSRVWLTAPVLVGVIAVPATLNVVTPGKAVWVLSTDPYWTITDSGLKAAGILVFRVGVSLSFAMLIAMTTKWNDFLGALRSLGFPKLFVMIVSLSYRYLGTLLRIASEMLLARRTRTVGKLSNDEGRRFIGRTFGALFGKSIKLSDDVHQAMLARGFDGQIRTLNPTRLRWADGLWSLSFVAVACLAILLNVSV